MNDEQQIRTLLAVAAEPPDHLRPPVAQLVERGRRARKIRAALSVVGVAAVTAATFAFPPVLRSLNPGSSRPPGVIRAPSDLFPGHPTRQQAGPSAGQLSRFRWSMLSASPLGRRSQPILTWTGRELLELGGPNNGKTSTDGAAFDPSMRRWHRIAPVPSTVGLAGAVTVWTGHELFVTNGRVPPFTAAGAPAGLYSPARNQWTVTALPRQMVGATRLTALWTGRDIVVAGVLFGYIKMASYDPMTSRWRVFSPDLAQGHPARFVAMVATSNRLVVWSFWDRVKAYPNGFSDRAGVDVMSVGRDGSWHLVTGDWPQNRSVTAPAFIGRAILLSPSSVWCGTRCSPPGGGPESGYFVDPTTLTRATIPPGPLGQTQPTFIWSGRAIIAVNCYTEIGNPGHLTIREDDMALYDPATRQWQTLPAPPGYPHMAAPPIWAGRQLLLRTVSGALLSFHA